jgi:hypothetical protein
MRPHLHLRVLCTGAALAHGTSCGGRAEVGPPLAVIATPEPAPSAPPEVPSVASFETESAPPPQPRRRTRSRHRRLGPVRNSAASSSRSPSARQTTTTASRPSTSSRRVHARTRASARPTRARCSVLGSGTGSSLASSRSGWCAPVSCRAGKPKYSRRRRPRSASASPRQLARARRRHPGAAADPWAQRPRGGPQEFWPPRPWRGGAPSRRARGLRA